MALYAQGEYQPPDTGRSRESSAVDEVDYLLDCWWSTVVDLEKHPAHEPGAVLEKHIAADLAAVSCAIAQGVLDRAARRRPVAKEVEGAEVGGAPLMMARGAFLAELRQTLGLGALPGKGGGDGAAAATAGAAAAKRSDESAPEILATVHHRLFGRAPWYRADGSPAVTKRVARTTHVSIKRPSPVKVPAPVAVEATAAATAAATASNGDRPLGDCSGGGAAGEEGDIGEQHVPAAAAGEDGEVAGNGETSADIAAEPVAAAGADAGDGTGATGAEEVAAGAAVVATVESQSRAAGATGAVRAEAPPQSGGQSGGGQVAAPLPAAEAAERSVVVGTRGAGADSGGAGGSSSSNSTSSSSTSSSSSSSSSSSLPAGGSSAGARARASARAQPGAMPPTRIVYTDRPAASAGAPAVGVLSRGGKRVLQGRTARVPLPRTNAVGVAPPPDASMSTTQLTFGDGGARQQVCRNCNVNTKMCADCARRANKRKGKVRAAGTAVAAARAFQQARAGGPGAAVVRRRR